MYFHDVTIPGAGGRQSPAVVIKPDNIGADAPLLVYFHGGGFALTAAPLHYSLCEHYARKAGCMVLVVDYRLAPRHPWPHGFNDCFDTLLWAREQHKVLGIDPDRIIVGGDSAGGAMSAGVAQKALDENLPLRGQLLIYPMLQPDADTESIAAYHDTPLWNSKINRLAWSRYLGDKMSSPPVYSAPGLSTRLAGLPPCYLETAEFDPLHDEGRHYAAALVDAGVDTELNATRGTFHGYELVRSSPLVHEALARRVDFLQRWFTPDDVRNQGIDEIQSR